MKYYLLLSILFISRVIVAQEHLEYTHVPKSKSQLKSSNISKPKQLVALPFIDDFAYGNTYPLNTHWCDSNAYVNTSYGIEPPTIGVVTLDALTKNGELFENASTNSFLADYLTSQPINLKTYRTLYTSDKLYRKNGASYELLSDSDYIYEEYSKTFYPATEGINYYSGDTIYKKIADAFIPQQDSLYSSPASESYIQGSYTNTIIWNPYTITDKIILSFFYQAGGKGNAPDETDSLCLEFYIPHASTGIFLNEITLNNIEIYNATDTIVSLQNYLILPNKLDTYNNDLVEIAKYAITNSIQISPYQHAIIPISSITGTLNNQTYYLYSSDMVLRDSAEFTDKITTEQSMGRFPDGNPTWSVEVISSLGACNPLWKRIWSTSNTVSDFTYASFPMANSDYLQKGFRFRFVNYASLSNDDSHARNEDFWNIDLVWLDANRNSTQTTLEDVAFLEHIYPLYNKHTAIPISHFKELEDIDFRMTVESKFKNYASESRKITFNFRVDNLQKNTALEYATYTTDLLPYQEAFEYDNLSDWNVDFYDFIKQETVTEKEADFTFTYFFSNNKNNNVYEQRWNDTSKVHLHMSNYYAYDDNVPEAGYGLRNAAMGRAAFKFDILKPDTLSAIQMYFNPTLYASKPIFNLCVWAVDKNGLPGELVYYQAGLTTKYEDGLYSYTTYPLLKEYFINQNANALIVDKSFYVGWEQPYDILLNVGVDLTSNISNRIYFNTGYAWEKSNVNGALMIRSIIGTNYLTNTPSIASSNELSIWPLPAKDVINIDAQEEIAKISILDMYCKTISEKYTHQNTLSVSNLKSGVYTIRIETTSGKVFFKKCVVIK